MPADPDRVRLAAEALARAQADAWARGDRPTAGPRRTGSSPDSPERSAFRAAAPSPAPGLAALGPVPSSPAQPATGILGAGLAARPRRDDPQPLTAAVGGLLSARGWRQRAAVGAVFGRWAEVVGPELAAHTSPEAFEDGELVVSADSAAWATQVRLLAPQLLRRLGAELGPGTVRRVRVQGPQARGRQRHVRLSQPQESVTTAKIRRSHRANASSPRVRPGRPA